MNNPLINNTRLFLLLLAGILTGTGLHAQGWGAMFGGGSNSSGSPYFADGNYTTGVHQLSDGRFLGIVNNNEGNATYQLDWFLDNGGYSYGTNPYVFNFENYAYHHFTRQSLLAGNKVRILEERLPVAGGQRDLYLTQYDLDSIPTPPYAYSQDWHRLVYAGANNNNPFAHSLAATADGGYVVLGSIKQAPGNNARDLVVIKTNADGMPQWSKTYPTPDHELGVRILPAAGGGYWVLKAVQPDADTTHWAAHLMRLDNGGNLSWETNLTATGSDRAQDMTATADGNLVISGMNIAAGRDPFLLKVAPDGSVLWRQDYPMPGRAVQGRCVLEDANGDLVLSGQILDSLTLETDILLMKTNASGVSLWERNLGKAHLPEDVLTLALPANGGYILGGWADPNNWPLALLIRTDENGIVRPGLITGNVFNDLDVDCAASAGDLPLQDWIVEAFQDSIRTFYAHTDSLGNYRIECDTGDYILNVIRPVDYWTSCNSDVSIHVGYQDSVNIDFPVQALIQCPYLHVEHSSSLVRPCDTTLFTVSYCNLGPAVAAGASLNLTLDDVFTMLASDLPPASQTGNQFTFLLGDIPSGDCGSFQFSTFVDCDAELYTVACSEVHIFPDSSCSPVSPNWSGAFIEAGSSCDGDSVRFVLTNTGLQAMPQILDYIVIEDAVLLMQGNYQLQPAQSFNFALPANGHTYHLIAQQEPQAPGSSLPLAAIEGCPTGSSTASTGFFNQFPQNDGNPFVSEYCPLVLNAYDPNDKQAVPTGFGDEHFIQANTDLEYTLRFQNTGNDTAFRVILVDTLSRFLDPATVRLGAHSHPCRLEIEDKGTLRFVFDGINLPDSTTNARASQGFVTFRIAQRRENPVGTRIENNADIYFNFNLPVRTNTVFHTIHEPLIKVTTFTQAPEGPQVRVEVSPNPWAEQLHIQIDGPELPGAVFRLINSAGQAVRTLPLEHNVAMIRREDLPAGLYFFTLEAGRQLLGSGKVAVY